MSVNKYKPHVLILPEDDADRQIANGFCTELGVTAFLISNSYLKMNIRNM